MRPLKGILARNAGENLTTRRRSSASRWAGIARVNQTALRTVDAALKTPSTRLLGDPVAAQITCRRPHWQVSSAEYDGGGGLNMSIHNLESTAFYSRSERILA